MTLVWLASFDIGKRNFCFYVEEVNMEDMRRLRNVASAERFNPDGTPTAEFGLLLDQVCSNGRTVLLKNSDLAARSDSSKYIDSEVFHNMTDLLDDYREYWDKCAAFVIEKQMNFGQRRNNTLATKLGQHCWSYFACSYGRFKEIVEFPAYHKTRVLGANKHKTTRNGKIKYKNVDKKTRKAWCTAKALDIITARGDQEAIKVMQAAKKKDDIGDVICQLQAFKYLVYVDESLT